MIKAPTVRKWYRCPICGAKVCLYDDTADCHGVFTVCTRGCRNEIEVLVDAGKQDIKHKQ